MRIVIDLQGAQTGSRFRGIGRYSTALAEATVRQAGEHEVWLLLNNLLPDSIPPLRARFGALMPPERIVAFSAPGLTHWDVGDPWRRRAAEHIRESVLAGLQPDIVHVCSLFEGAQEDAVISIGRGGAHIPTAVTLYDLIPLLNPQEYLGSGWGRDWYMDRVASLRNADLLLSISEHARDEAIMALGVPAERIVNMSSAVSDEFRPVPVDEILGQRLAAHGVRTPYVMYSCAFESRKNVDRLLHAFAALPVGLAGAHQLVIAGKVNPVERERLVSLAGQLGIGERFVLPGYVEDDDLIRLYSATALYVFPSLHEGFGLPALEAMACGAPTIGSGTTSVPEVIGREDALFDPTDVPAMTALMARALSDKDFADSLRAFAPQQAARFSWDASARVAIDAFERLHAEQVAAGRRVVNPHLSTARGLEDQLQAIASIASGHEVPDDDIAQVAVALAHNRVTLESIDRGSPLPEHIAWRVEGPFDTSYSLALVNRELARALSDAGHDVALHSTEGPGDFDPDSRFLRARPDIAALHARAASMPAPAADVSSRDLYPPRVADMVAPLNMLHCYAWEETGFPHEWVDAFNRHLDGITCLSVHVEKVLIDNGVGVPLAVAGCGTDHWERVVADRASKAPGKAFRFLHVSSCFPRKGADALLQAWGRAFRASDDVTLVIKTFANPHNRVHDWLADARRGDPGYPDVAIIEEDLDDAHLKALYEDCHALVAPSRAEGYGLPLAEAMLSGLPVIATGWSGQLDFCNADTAWLVDYTFAAAESHFELDGSAWANPDVDDLARVMRAVYVATPEERAAKNNAAVSLLRASHTWPAVADRLVDSARTFAERRGASPPRVGLVSSWNTRCGVATYSAHLFAETDLAPTIFAPRATAVLKPDDASVLRCWEGESTSLDALAAGIDEHQIDVLVVQFQYSFWDFPTFNEFLKWQQARGRTVVVVMHATSDPGGERKRLRLLAEGLRGCSRVLVHSIGDLNRLKDIGIVENVALFPHGVLDAATRPITPLGTKFTLATYGFFLPHKGLPEIVEAVALLARQGHDVHLRMVNAEFPDPSSREHIALVRSRLQALGVRNRVRMETEFLSDAESLEALAEADAIVFPYQRTGESASGAVRYGLAVGRPVLVTPIRIFDDVRSATFSLPGTTAAEIAAGIEAFMSEQRRSTSAFEATAAKAARWRDAHRYSRLGARLEHMLLQLHRRAATQRNPRKT
ncbi:glycosyltransferase [Lysobacter sp. HA18]